MELPFTNSDKHRASIGPLVLGGREIVCTNHHRGESSSEDERGVSWGFLGKVRHERDVAREVAGKDSRSPLAGSFSLAACEE